MGSSPQQFVFVSTELIAACACLLAFTFLGWSVALLRAAVILIAASIIYRYGCEFGSGAITSFRAAVGFPAPLLYWSIFAIPAGLCLFFVITSFTPAPARRVGVAVFVLLSIFSVWFAREAGLGGMLLWNLSAPFSLLPLFLGWALLWERRSCMSQQRSNQAMQRTADRSAISL